MPKSTYILCAMLLLSCNSTEFNSHWRIDPIRIDRNGVDWSYIHLEFVEDMNMVFGIVNDDSALFLMIRLGDVRLAHQIEMRGVMLWLDGSGQENKSFGLRYKNENLFQELAGRNVRMNPNGGFPMNRPPRDWGMRDKPPEGGFRMPDMNGQEYWISVKLAPI